MFRPFSISLFILLLLLAFSSPAQNYNIDSMKVLLNDEIHDTVRMKTLDRIGHGMMRKGEMQYARAYAQQSLDLRLKLDNKKGIASAYNTLGNICLDLSEREKALEYHLKALAIREEIRDQKGIASSYNNIGIFYFNLSDFPKAIEYMQKSMKIREQMGNQYYVAASIGNIAVLYDKLGVGSSRVDLQACKLEYSIVSPK